MNEPMIEFRTVTRKDLRAVCALTVAPDQAVYVSPNVMTMAEAQFEPGALVRGMWEKDNPVGLLAMLRPYAYPEDQDIVVRRDAAFVWRLMVDQNFQGQGFSRLALDEAKRTAIEWGYNAMTLTAGDGPNSAIPIYQKYGFELTGRRLWDDEGELEMICQFTDRSQPAE